MNKFWISLILIFTFVINVNSSDFISEWNTSVATGNVTNSTQIKLPLESTGTYNFYVDWGDGTNNTITVWNQTEVIHNYATGGVKTVKINGTIIGFRFNYAGDRNKILNIEQWGDLNVGNNSGYFQGCSNLNSNATDALNLIGTTTLRYMFSSTSKFNGSINNWDTSQVTDISYMFSYASNFNQPLDNWNTSKVKDMRFMFNFASKFNGSINNWDTSSVIYLNNMFNYASNFNQPLNNFNTSLVTTMAGMFYYASNFNQPLNNWNTSLVTTMASMFEYATNFNQNISSWNTGKVSAMSNIFYFATNFNQNISNWCVPTITTKPTNFDTSSGFSGQTSKQPQWGTCSNMPLVVDYLFFDEGIINQNYTYILVNANTNVNSCKLNWNGTLFNMITSGSYCYLNKSDLIDNTYTYYIEANRSNVLNTTSIKIVTFQNASASSSSMNSIFPMISFSSIIITFSLLIGSLILN